MASVTDGAGATLDDISCTSKNRRAVNTSNRISRTSTTSCWACKSKEEQPSLMKASFRDLRKNDGSIWDFAECNWNIIFLAEEYKVDFIWSLEDHNTGKTFKHCKITFA